MRKYKVFKIILLLFLLLSFTSCETVADCIKGISPSLISKELNTGAIFTKYEDNVTFKMLNTSTGDYIISSVSVQGNLPPGINYSTLNNNKVSLSGTPTAVGTYEFTVSIKVRPSAYNEDGTDDLCGNSSSQTYKIIIK